MNMKIFLIVLIVVIAIFVVVMCICLPEDSGSTSGSDGVEIWRTGNAATNLNYSEMMHMSQHQGLIFQSQIFTSYYFVYPAPATQKTIKSAKIHLLDRTGSYTGQAELTLGIYDYLGTLQHTVSTSPTDLQTALLNTWSSITISSAAADLVIAPGELLVFNISLSGGTGGDLRVSMKFEIEVS